MKKGQCYEGMIERVDFPNKGIAIVSEEINGEQVKTAVTIKGTLPGQKVEFILTKKRKGKCEGRLTRVIEKADMETQAPLCPHFGLCGGCTYQTISYEEQCRLKEKQVKSLLDYVIDKEYEFEGILPSPVYTGYRNKMEFSFGDACKDGPLALGMHKKGSFYDIVTTNQCKIVDEDYNRILSAVLDYFTKKNVKYYHKMTHVGFLRHLLIRRGVTTGEILIGIVTTSQTPCDRETGKTVDMDWEEFSDMLLALPLRGKIAGISHIVNDSLSDAVISDRMDMLYGQDYFYEEILGLRFKISMFSFFQTNTLGAQVLYEKVREYVGKTEDKVVFDLYSGTGTIAQITSPVAKKVVGVEIVEEAVKAARENAKQNHLDNCEFIARDVLKVMDGIEQKPDLIILDPPRDGIHPKALEKIMAYQVEKMVYISCKPTSLARDLKPLQENGYEVEKVCVVEQFPMTANVETVCLLSNRKPDTKVRIDVDLEDYYSIKDARKNQN